MNAGPVTVASYKRLSLHTIISTEYNCSTKLHTTNPTGRDFCGTQIVQVLSLRHKACRTIEGRPKHRNNKERTPTWHITLGTVPSFVTVAEVCAIWRLLTGAMNVGPVTVASYKRLSLHTIISTEYNCSTKLHTTDPTWRDFRGTQIAEVLSLRHKACRTAEGRPKHRNIKRELLPGTSHSGPYHPSSQLQKYVPFGACSQLP